MTDWRDSFTTWADGLVKPLGNTIAKPGQGEAGTAIFPAGLYPACSLHGAMNKVAPAPLWRCPTCNIGVEIVARTGMSIDLDRPMFEPPKLDADMRAGRAPR